MLAEVARAEVFKFVPALAVIVPEMGCVTPEPSTVRAVIPVLPWTVRTSELGVPAEPIAGCLADVAAPDGSAEELTTTAPVFTTVIFPSIEARLVFPVSCFVAVEAPAGNGRLVADTGCVVAELSVTRAVIPGLPCTVITSVEGVPATPKAGCLAAVAAPVGSAELDTTTAPVLTVVILLSIDDKEAFPVT
jgi:hypothetical protein